MPGLKGQNCCSPTAYSACCWTRQPYGNMWSPWPCHTSWARETLGSPKRQKLRHPTVPPPSFWSALSKVPLSSLEMFCFSSCPLRFPMGSGDSAENFRPRNCSSLGARVIRIASPVRDRQSSFVHSWKSHSMLLSHGAGNRKPSGVSNHRRRSKLSMGLLVGHAHGSIVDLHTQDRATRSIDLGEL